MANPIANIPASIKLRSDPTQPPTVVTTEVDGVLVRALQVRGIIASPNPGEGIASTESATVRTVLAGKPFINFDSSFAGIADLLGGFVNIPEFDAQTQVDQAVEGLTAIPCLLPSTSTDEVLVNADEAEDYIFAEGQHSVNATYLNADAYIHSILNQRLSVTVTVSIFDLTLCTLPAGQTITLAQYQSVLINGSLRRVAAAVAGSNTFTVDSSVGAEGTFVATIGARMVVRNSGGSAGVLTANTTTTRTIDFGPYARMSSNAIGAILPGTNPSVDFVLYTALKGLSAVREGDFFEMAVGITYFNLSSPPSDYRYLAGFVRKPNAATRSFLIWSAETGGEPVTEVEGENAWFIGASTAELPVINVYQKKDLRFPLHGYRVKCRAVERPQLNYGPQGMRCVPTRLVGRLVSRPAIGNIAASHYIKLKPTTLNGRLIDAPTIRSIEVSVTAIRPGRLRLRKTKANLSGGFLRLSATVRPKVTKATGIHAFQVIRTMDALIGSPTLFERPSQPPSLFVGAKLEPNSGFPQGANVTSVGPEYETGIIASGDGRFSLTPTQHDWLEPRVRIAVNGVTPDVVSSVYAAGTMAGEVQSDGETIFFSGINIPFHVNQRILINGFEHFITETGSQTIKAAGFSGSEFDTPTVQWGPIIWLTNSYASGELPSAPVGRKITVSANASSTVANATCVFSRPLVTPFLLFSNGEEITRIRPGRLICRVPLAKLTGHEQLRRESAIRLLVRGRATFVIAGRGISVRDIVADVLSLWNLRCACPKQNDIRERVISDINAAMQIIFSRARRLEYLSNSVLTVQVGPSGSAPIPNTVQHIHGNARMRTSEPADSPSVPLFALGSAEEVTQFTTLYGAHSRPVGYYIDRTLQAEANSTASTLRIAPKPTGTVYVDLDVAMAAPRYTWGDYDLATPLHIPVAYAESLLMPIVRHRAMTFRLFTNLQAKPQIEQHYRRAMEQLGLNDSTPEAAAKPETKEALTKQP